MRLARAFEDSGVQMLTVHGAEWEVFAVGGTPAQAVLHGLLEVWHTASLSSRLEDSTCGLHCVGQLLAQFDGQAARLFAVDILARLSRQHGCRRVPAIPSGDQNGINVLAVQKFLEVAIKFAV